MRRVLDYLVLASIITAIIFAFRYFNLAGPKGQSTVVDGDSLRLGPREIRLYGIDAPELGQKCQRQNGKRYNCGRMAKNHLRKLIGNKPVKCLTIDFDRYDREISNCRAGKTDLNFEMVHSGWAVAYLSISLTFAKAEANARKNKRGIWQGNFLEPKEWRANRR